MSVADDTARDVRAIVDALKADGRTIYNLSSLSGVNQSVIAKLKNGQKSSATATTLRALTRVLLPDHDFGLHQIRKDVAT